LVAIAKSREAGNDIGMTLAAALPDWLPRVSPQVAGAIGFALRQWLAAMLALYVCFALQLESPYWALLTVWIVAQPTPGMVLSKSLYLVFGTIAGAIMGIALIAIFTQAPELFVVALALIVGGCTVASNILTNFRAYGTVLAGYTAGIVASGSLNTPDQAFFIGVARATSILVGISCSIVVTMIFAPHRSEAATREKLLAVLKDAARRAAYSWQASNETRLQIGRKLIFDLMALNTLIEFAAAESGAFRLLANGARSLLAHIFSLVSARRSLDAHLARCGWPRHHALEVFHGVILDFLHEMPELLDRGRVDELIAGLNEVWRQLKVLEPEEETLPAEEVVSERFVIDRLDDLLKNLDGALRDWRDILQGRWEDEPRLDLNFHRDLRAAWINGLRAFVAVGAMGAFWIASAWDHGTLALIFVAVLMSLFSALPHPDQFGLKFLKAGLLALPLALVCKYLIMPASSGFEYLCMALGLFFVPLALIMSNPARAPIATGFAFIFIYLIRPDNVMTYDLSDTLNTALGVLTGVLFGALSYMLIFPPSPKAARRYVIYRIRQGLEVMAQRNPIPRFCYWETRMYDRVMRLNDSQNPSGTPGDEWLDAGLKAVTLGDELLRLRYGLERGGLPAPAASALRGTMAAFGHFVSKPDRAAAEVRERLRQLGPLDPGPRQPGRREWARTVGSLSEINIFLSHFPRS
jgi:uncharacterized membrane protein YccC